MTSPIHPETLHTVIALAVVSLASLVGMASFALGSRLDKALPYLISAAAGALLGTAAAHLLPEAIRLIGGGQKLAAFLLAGLLGSFLLERVLWITFSKEAAEVEDGRPTLKLDPPHHVHEHGHGGKPLAANILLGGAAHSLIDGIAIAAAFAVGHQTGVAATAAVLLHEVPHHIADVGVLIYTGLTKKRAVLLNLIATSGCVVGGIFVLALGSRIESFIPALLPLTAANFLYIGLAILLPELQRETDRRKSALQCACLGLGVAAMFVLGSYVGG